VKKPLFYLIVIALALGPFSLSLFFWNSLPAVMATHWGVDGQPNGWMPKTGALLFLPVLNMVLLAVFLLIPLIDPLKKNIEAFRKYFDGFIMIVLLFMLAIHCQTVLWSRGLRVDPTLIISPAMSVIFFYMGVLLSRAKQNWFIGIRTPWTLSSPEVWRKTHAVGAVLFKALGGLSLISVLFRPWGLLVVACLILLSALFLIILSFILFQSEQKKKRAP